MSRRRMRPDGPRGVGAPVLALAAACLFLFPTHGRGQERPFPYSLSGRDAALVSAGLATSALGSTLQSDVDPLTAGAIALLDRGSVNAFDRRATHNWSTGWQDVSDGVRSGLVAASGVIAFAPLVRGQRWSEAVTLGVIFAEAATLTAGVTYTTKALTKRTRPYAYNDALTPERRAAVGGDSGKVSLSFFSGHASASFAAATLLATVYGDVHGPGRASQLVWASGLSAATLVAYARVAGGMHFPTDVLTGAVVGAAIGHLVPRLHRRPNGPVRVVATPGHMGLRWTF